ITPPPSLPVHQPGHLSGRGNRPPVGAGWMDNADLSTFCGGSGLNAQGDEARGSPDPRRAYSQGAHHGTRREGGDAAAAG
ncbi:MAG: hypothetical protein WBC76_05810, partial [Actinomycetes bacterium]